MTDTPTNFTEQMIAARKAAEARDPDGKAGVRARAAEIEGNPFEHGPGKGNETEQMIMINAAPERAFRQMLSAGYQPKDWGIDVRKYGYTVVDKEISS